MRRAIIDDLPARSTQAKKMFVQTARTDNKKLATAYRTKAGAESRPIRN